MPTIPDRAHLVTHIAAIFVVASIVDHAIRFFEPSRKSLQFLQVRNISLSLWPLIAHKPDHRALCFCFLPNTASPAIALGLVARFAHLWRIVLSSSSITWHLTS